jgi:hypothetical protein
VSSYADVLGLINTLNASGVSFAERLSPRVLTDLLDVTGPWVADFIASLAPHGEARISVLWAGEERSENWMDVGREYTERWHHQMQIREAVGAPVLLERRWLHPLLDLSVRAFRRAYAGVEAPVGTAVVFEVDGDAAYSWSVIRETSAWAVVRGRAPGASASVRASAGTAWKLLYNALPHDAALALVVSSGDPRLVAPMLGARSVMA